MMEKLLSFGDSLVDGETEATYAKLKGSPNVVAPRLPSTLPADDVRDDMEQGDDDDMASYRSRSHSSFNSFSTADDSMGTYSRTYTGDTEEGTLFSSSQLGPSMGSSYSQSFESQPVRVGDPVFPFAENQPQVGCLNDAKLMDDGGNFSGRVYDQKKDLDQQVELDYVGRVIEKVGARTAVEHDVPLQSNSTFASQCGQEVELANVPSIHKEQQVGRPKCSGESVEVEFDPTPKKTKKMTAQLASSREKPSAVVVQDYYFSGASRSSASGITSSDASRMSSAADISVATTLVNNTRAVANLRRDNSMSTAASSSQKKTGKTNAKDTKEAKSSSRPIKLSLLSSTKASFPLSPTKSSFPLSPTKAKAFFKKKKPLETKPKGILSQTSKYGRRPNLLSPKKKETSNSNSPKDRKNLSFDYISSRKMKSFPIRTTTVPVAQKTETFSPESESVKLDSTMEDTADDETFDTPMTNDHTAITNDRTAFTNDYTAFTGATTALTSDDRRNVLEKVADITYEAIQFCFENVMCDCHSSSYSSSVSIDLIDEKDKHDAKDKPIEQKMPSSTLAPIIVAKDEKVAKDKKEYAALQADRNKGVEMNIDSPYKHMHGSYGKQGIISVGYEDNFIVGVVSSDKSDQREEVGIDTSDRSNQREKAGDHSTSLEEQPVKSPKRRGLRMPSFRRRKNDNDSLDEDMMADLLDEIGRMESMLSIESSGGGSCDYDLPQDFSDLVANAIAEEAVLSCLEPSLSLC